MATTKRIAAGITGTVLALMVSAVVLVAPAASAAPTIIVGNTVCTMNDDNGHDIIVTAPEDVLKSMDNVTCTKASKAGKPKKVKTPKRVRPGTPVVVFNIN